MTSVAIEHWAVTVADLSGVSHDDDLGRERDGAKGGIVLGVGSDVTTLDVLHRHVLTVETDVVSRDSLLELLVVHLDGLDLSGKTTGAEEAKHTRLQDTGLHTAHRDCADTTDLVHVLKGKTKGLVGRTLGLLDTVEGLEEDGTLVPGHVLGALDHVVSNPSGDRDEVHLSGLVSNLLQVTGDLLLDIVVTRLGVAGGIHLVEGDNHLGDTKSVGQKSVLLGLAISGPSTLETTGGGVDDKDGNISLRGTGNHVLDEITMSRGINNSELETRSLELPKGNINCDTTLTLSLEVIKNPGVLERSLTELGSLLLELLDGTLVNTTALVDQVTGGGGLTGIDVTDDDEGNVNLFFAGNTKCLRRNEVNTVERGVRTMHGI